MCFVMWTMISSSLFLYNIVNRQLDGLIVPTAPNTFSPMSAMNEIDVDFVKNMLWMWHLIATQYMRFMVTICPKSKWQMNVAVANGYEKVVDVRRWLSTCFSCYWHLLHTHISYMTLSVCRRMWNAFDLRVTETITTKNWLKSEFNGFYSKWTLVSSHT